MIGNLKIFFGEEALNTYAHWLRLIGEPALPGEGMLWIIRVVLLVSVVAHIVAATILARRARAARPVKYAHRRPVTTSYASRTMRWGGVIILLFVIYHILDLTTGTLNPNGVPGEVYDNVVADFSRWYITLAYTRRDGRCWASTCGTASGARCRPSAGPAARTRRATRRSRWCSRWS